MKRILFVCSAFVLAFISTESYAQTPPPGTREPIEEPIYAVALEAGSLRATPEVTEDELFTFDAGANFLYLGEATDTFGRDWEMVGDPESWSRRERWLVVAATPEELEGRVGPVTLITGVAVPAMRPERTSEQFESEGEELSPYELYLASLRQPLTARLEWWRNILQLDASDVRDFGETLAVPAWRVPPHVVDEAVSMLGGLDSLGPWPQEASFGALHVTSILPLVFRRGEQGWESLGRLRSALPVLSLLSNSQLQLDPNLPAEATGYPLPCWHLAGGLDPRGLVAGQIGLAPSPPTRLAAAVRRDEDRFLGSFDLTTRVWPAATAEAAVPRRVVPSALATGVMLQDTNRRQAVYLEQRLPPALSRRLRGRELRLDVVARAAPGLDGTTSTATIGFEIEAGELREVGSETVGSLPGTGHLVVTIPEHADNITVRLLPADRSLAVGEAGRAILEHVTLAPTDWPKPLLPAPVMLRRVRVDLYAPTIRYTRAALAISAKPPAELSRVWQALDSQQLDEKLRRMILAAELDFEMNVRHVLAAWGEPTTRHDAGVRRWDWDNRSVTFDQDGRLIAWTEQAKDADLPVPQCLAPTNEAAVSASP